MGGVTSAVYGIFNPSGGGLPNRSLDLESGSSQYLSMSFGNFGGFNTAKWAISVWVKRESTGSGAQAIMSQYGTAGQNSFELRIVDNQIEITTSVNGTNLNGRLLTTAQYTSTTNWYHILFWYDSANATAGDRMRLWMNGSEVTAFDADTNPTSSVHSSSNAVAIGNEKIGAADYFDGLIYQLSFFSGTLPNINTLYNAGAPMSVVSMTGLYSYLDCAGNDPTSDGVLATNWTNNNSVTTSSTIP